MFSNMPRGVFMTLSIACLLLVNIYIYCLHVYMFLCLVMCRAQLILNTEADAHIDISELIKNDNDVFNKGHRL